VNCLSVSFLDLPGGPSGYSTPLEALPLQRALERAPERPGQGAARPEREFFCFKVGSLSLGVPSESVREVIRAGAMTPIPRAPGFLLGVTGHRGEVLPVIDLLRFLAKGEAKVGPRTRLFVGLTGKSVVALIADQVKGLERIPLADVQPAPAGAEHAEFILGVVTRGEVALLLVDLPKLLGVAQQRAVSR
jgi:purine-binding chemotaxis protein CheW